MAVIHVGKVTFCSLETAGHNDIEADYLKQQAMCVAPFLKCTGDAAEILSKLEALSEEITLAATNK